MIRPNAAPTVAAAALSAIALVSCSGGNGASDNRSSELACSLPAGPLAVALSRRANSPGDLPATVSHIVERFVDGTPAGVTGPPLTLINIDGRPGVQQSAQFRSDAGNQPALDDDHQQFVAGFLSTAASMRAAEPEADVLAALEQAARAAGRPKAGTVVLVDSGLATTGALDFSQPGVLDAPADDLVRFLRTTGELPDLRGLTVVLDGIGTVARPQQTLDPRREKNLIAMWTKIVEAGGAACVTSVETPPRSNSPVDGQLKPVKLVPVPAPPVFDPTRVTVLPDSGEVGFEPGQAVFRDPEAARTVLGPIAAQLKADHAYHLRLTGTTARWGPRDDQVDLARRRAAAVKQELISLGADPSQIDTRGTGSYFPQYRPDNGPGGVLLPGPAQANRTVRVEPCNPACPPDSDGPPS